MHNSGIFVNYNFNSNAIINSPIVYWPDIGIGQYTYNKGAGAISTTGIFEGQRNAIRFTPDTQSGFHGMYFSNFPSIGTGSMSSGIYRFEGKFYLPSSNSIMKSYTIFKQDGSLLITSSTADEDKWVTLQKDAYFGNTDNTTANDQFGFLVYSGNALNNSQFTGNNSDVLYFKDMKLIWLSGSNFINLIQPLEGIQSVNYNLNIPRQSILQIGKKGSYAQVPIETPTVNLEIVAIQNILSNENKIGFNLNYPCFFSGYNGQSLYSDFNYDILSRFTSRLYTGMTGLSYPLQYADKRNIFVAISSGNKDLKTEIGNFGNSTYGFGNCYLSSYSWSVAVGQLPITKFNYICENAQFYDTNNGQLPSLAAKTATSPSGQAFVIPNIEKNNNIASASPLDTIITLNNNAYGGDINTDSLGVRFKDLKIQGASFELNLERRNLESIGYQLPINRKINFPAFVNLSIDAIVGSEYIGSLNNYFRYDSPYDIKIQLNNKCSQTGPESYKNTLVQYDFKSSYLNSINYNSSIGPSKSVTFNFIQELNSDNQIGLFISGLVYGRTLTTTGTTNNLLFKPIEFIHQSGNLTSFNSII
jgi:hypothetical protein